MTDFLGPAVLYGYDPFKQTSGDSDYINPSLLERQYTDAMTQDHDVGYGFTGQRTTLDLSSWTLDFPVDGQSLPSTQYSAVSGSDATKSPGRHSHQQSSGRSENTGSPASQVVFTPTSSHEHDVFAIDGSEGAFEDEDDSSKSPLSDSIYSSTTDSSFFFVNYPESGETLPTGRPAPLMNTRPQLSTSGASAQPSRASSVAHSVSPNHTTPAEWNATLSAPNGAMSSDTSHVPSHVFADSDGFVYGPNTFDAHNDSNLRYDLMADLTTPGNGATNDLRNVTQSSFRTFDDGAQHLFNNFTYTTSSPFGQPALPAQQLRERQHYFASQYQQSQNLFAHQQGLQHAHADVAGYEMSNVPRTTSHVVNLPAARSMAPTGNMPIRSQSSRIVVHQPQPSASARAAPYPQPYTQVMDQVTTHPHSQHRRVPNPAGSSNRPTAPSRRVHLAPREDPRPHVVPSNAPGASIQTGSNRKGGRARNTHLKDDVRQQTSRMRGITACWRCALQRDKCDDNLECRRCHIRSQKGQLVFGCDRSKLPDWIDELLPLSMTSMHSRPTIEKYVVDEVRTWNKGNSIDIYLTSGYGPPLIWRCCEFEPKNQELLHQLQYFQDPSSGKQQRRSKYSPPFALAKLDESDDAHFQEYLDQLMHPSHLNTLGWTFFDEECEADPLCFQAQALHFMCKLLAETRDAQLREALQDIVRMLIITYIMGHTLTIAEDTLPTVLASVKYTPRAIQPEQHTSPRLANRQLKHYFSSLRNSLYLKVLHRQQQTFHDSKKKEAHWLVSFCAMLGLAMVLEEVQRTIHIQADSNIIKRVMTPEAANAEALRHCQGIDGKYERLIHYFQKKYRDRKWGDDGSFGRRTPNYRTMAELNFLTGLYNLLLQRQDHLRIRESVPLGPENQCQYTTRLVAKFLLPFLNLAT